MDSTVVHVVSRSPSVMADGGTGEFDWFRERDDAAREFAGKVVQFAHDEGVNLALTSLEVPAQWLLDNEAVTAWLDANWHLIEVSLHSD